jgi:hypothetical protein
VLHNPDMGWVAYEDYVINSSSQGGSSLIAMHPQENLDGVDAVGLLCAWSDLEPEEGRYDFSKIDCAYDYWKKHGKQLQLRMSTESWIRGQTYPIVQDLRFSVPPGEYQLCLTVIDPRTGKPIALPLRDGRPDGSHAIGRITAGPALSR